MAARPDRALPSRPPAAIAALPHDDKALRLAQDYLADRPERNISLDELAIAAGIGKFRLIRLIRQRTGLPPHALQLAHRIRSARRMLEAGQTITEAATATGFADQSHLHRHFQRSLGVTPPSINGVSPPDRNPRPGRVSPGHSPAAGRVRR